MKNIQDLTQNTDLFLTDLKNMHQLFDATHPKQGLKKGQNLLTSFSINLKNEFPRYDQKILRLISQKFIGLRVKLMNKLEMDKKIEKKAARQGKISKSKYQSLRARMKLAQHASK